MHRLRNCKRLRNFKQACSGREECSGSRSFKFASCVEIQILAERAVCRHIGEE